MRVGMLTSGGDCQSLNATMRGVAKTLYNQKKDVEIIGFTIFSKFSSIANMEDAFTISSYVYSLE